MKKGLLILCMLTAAIALSACGVQETQGGTAEKVITLTEKVKGIASDTEELAELTAEDLTDVLGAVPEDCREFVFYQSVGTDGREILVIRSADRDAARRVAALAENYLERRRKETRNYAPEAYRLLTEAAVQTRNLTVALIIGPNAAKETEAVLAGE